MGDYIEFTDPVLKAFFESIQKSPKKKDFDEYPGPAPDSPTGVQIERLPGFEQLNKLDKFSAKMAATALQVSIVSGQIDPNRVHRVFEFGASGGGSTFALKNIADRMGATTEASEISESSRKRLIESKILPEESISGDGLLKLREVAARGDRYDLIAAFMLGPLLERSDLIPNFFAAAGEALSRDGKVIVTSDAGSAGKLRELLKDRGIEHYFLDGVTDNISTLPPTFVLSKESALKLSKNISTPSLYI